MNKIFVWITALSLPSNLFSLRLLKNCTSRFPRISIKFTDLRKHPFTISVLLLTVVWVQVEWFFFFISGTGTMEKDCFVAHMHPTVSFFILP